MSDELMSFSVKVDARPGKTHLVFAGPIDENVQLPNIGFPAALSIDLKDVTYINSIGIKMWIDWITPLGEKMNVEFHNCPKAVVLQMNMVKNFLPKNSTVVSFFLPLFCEACDREESILLKTAEDISVAMGDRINILKDLPEAVGCGRGEACEIEMDVIEKKYFRFLEDEK